jgi:hypothetical protein
MRYLYIAAWAITALGAATTLLGVALSLDALWVLAGILLVITGIVKIVMLMIWTRLARLGTDEHEPINAL